jgi:hypothetical protein
MDKLMYSPFDFPEFLSSFKKSGILITKSISNADLIMSSYINILEKYTTKWGSQKKYLLWTHEPYHNWSYRSTIKENGTLIHIMNCYTNDVFTHNYRYFYFKTPLVNKLLSNIGANSGVSSGVSSGAVEKSIVVLSTYYEPSYYAGNKYTILPIRYQVIEEGVHRGMVDVHGKGWEKHKFVKSVTNSRNDSDRRESKRDILGGYKFNICLENVNFPYYVTEKIWEAIKWGCLPIYYSNTTIYQSLPEGSFIDVRQYLDTYGNEEGIKRMYEDIANMTQDEYINRYNKCVEGYNQIIKDGHNNTIRLRSDNLNINYVEYNSCYNSLLSKIKHM